MSFPRYPKYKPSGVEWLGEVPEGWGIGRSRRLFALRNERARKDDKQLTASQKHGVIYQDTFIQLEGRRVVEVVTGADILRHVEPNDFVISMRSFQGGIEWCNLRGCISSAYVMLVPCERIHSPFFAYVLKSTSYIQSLQTTSNLVRDGQALRYENFAKVDLPIVPLAEQRAIAEFLDREAGKIDGLVAEQRRLMELLKEKRQTVISHAVTKGLNPHAPMKPSGIEWLGDVPVGWEIKPLRSVFKFSKGLTITKENLQDEGVSCVNYGEIHSKYGFRLNPAINPLRCVAPEYLSSNPEALISGGDFVFADTSEDLEGSGNFTHLCSGDPIFAGYHTIIARPRKCISSLFLAYQFHTSVFRSQIQSKVKGVKVFSISQGILKAAKCLLPPHDEQTAIAEFLESELLKFDTLTAEAQRAIDLLQERRTALISAAVTGQIDVRQQPKN